MSDGNTSCKFKHSMFKMKLSKMKSSVVNKFWFKTTVSIAIYSDPILGVLLSYIGMQVSSNSSYILCRWALLWQNAALRKHAYSNIKKISHPKTENFEIKNSDICHIFAQNIDCGYSLEQPRRGGSNEYTQSMFLAEIRKIMYTPVNPSFTI